MLWRFKLPHKNKSVWAREQLWRSYPFPACLIATQTALLAKDCHGGRLNTEGLQPDRETVGDVLGVWMGEDGKVVGREFSGPGIKDLYEL